MKKLLAILMTAALILELPVANILAEQELSEADSEGTVELVASKASSYSIKLPIQVDVSATSTTFKAYVKGDVDGSKKIVIAEDKSAGDNYLKDEANLKPDVPLEITIDKAMNGEDIQADYTSDGITFTVLHDPIDAGNFKCNLPLTITLTAI